MDDGEQLGDPLLVMGRLGSPFGVKGWLHVTAYTELPENLLSYLPWYINRQGSWQKVEVISGRRHGKGLVVQLKDCSDRDAAALLTGTEVGVYRHQLPPAAADEYYWDGNIIFTYKHDPGLFEESVAFEKDLVGLRTKIDGVTCPECESKNIHKKISTFAVKGNLSSS